jgi:hypothetical protein
MIRVRRCNSGINAEGLRAGLPRARPRCVRPACRGRDLLRSVFGFARKVRDYALRRGMATQRVASFMPMLAALQKPFGRAAANSLEAVKSEFRAA